MWEERDTTIQKFGFLKEAFYAYQDCIYLIKNKNCNIFSIYF